MARPTPSSPPRPPPPGAPASSPSSASARPRPSATPSETLARIGDQLAGSIPDGATPDRLAVAYEPVWAIGTGRTPSLPEIAEVHGFMRETLARRFGADAAAGIRLLYGGSVKPANAAAIFAVPNVDGALVGGASLTAPDFGAIIAAAG